VSPFLDASVSVILADYVGVDAAGKLNIVGGGLMVMGVQPDGNCAPHHVVALVDLPGKYAGQNFSLALSLWNAETDSGVQLPGPNGKLEALRIQQIATAVPTYLPGGILPQDFPIRVQMSIGFPSGLPLPSGARYVWKADIEGQRKKGWRGNFYVLAPPSPPPVIGGPAGAANIGDLGPEEIDDDLDD